MAQDKKKKRNKHKKQDPISTASSIDEMLERWKSGIECPDSSELWMDTMESIQEASGDQLKHFMELWIGVILDTPIDGEGLKIILRKTAEHWPTDSANKLTNLLKSFRACLNCAIEKERQDVQRLKGLKNMEPVVIATIIALASA